MHTVGWGGDCVAPHNTIASTYRTFSLFQAVRHIHEKGNYEAVCKKITSIHRKAPYIARTLPDPEYLLRFQDV